MAKRGLDYITLSLMGLVGTIREASEAVKAVQVAAAAQVTSRDGPPAPRYSNKRDHMPKLKGRNRRVW